MASILMKFDTSTKELEVTIDGETVDSVMGVNLYPSYDDEDEFRCCIMTKSEDEITDIKKYTSICAAEKIEITKLSKVQADIASYFGS